MARERLQTATTEKEGGEGERAGILVFILSFVLPCCRKAPDDPEFTQKEQTSNSHPSSPLSPSWLNLFLSVIHSLLSECVSGFPAFVEKVCGRHYT
jgi:hypothetical protein